MPTIARLNKTYEIEVTAYNEGTPERLEGGIVSRTKSAEVTLRVLYMHLQNTKYRRDKAGQRYLEEGFSFQISAKELSDKSFTIIAGDTFIIKDGNIYRVVEVKDYTMYPLTSCMQCRVVRMLNVD